MKENMETHWLIKYAWAEIRQGSTRQGANLTMFLYFQGALNHILSDKHVNIHDKKYSASQIKKQVVELNNALNEAQELIRQHL